MPFLKKNGIEYFQFNTFQNFELKHGIFTRHGGVSQPPWNTLNVGGLSGDSKKNIIENRQRIFDTLSRLVESVYDVWQVHSVDVICTNAPRGLDNPHHKADAIITDNPDVTLFMRFGDCVPIIFYDPVKHAIGMAHAGWLGTVKKIAKSVVEAMRENYGSIPDDIIAGIGPSIGVDHYEIGIDVIQIVKSSFSDCWHDLLITNSNNTFFDLWKANQLVLEQAGISQVEVAGVCTACNVSDWFSHRGDKGKTGRFGALLGLGN
jgi:YfiH family protein